jgi:hypothetical protein
MMKMIKEQKKRTHHTYRHHQFLLSIIIYLSCTNILGVTYWTQAFSEGISAINSISVSNPNPLSINNNTLSGADALRLTISNNNAYGYTVSASSAHSGYLTLANLAQSTSAKRINYKIACDAYSDLGSATIAASSAQQLTSEKNIYIHDYYLLGATYNAQPYCDLSSTDTLTSKFSGTYSDTITFNITNES